MTTLQFATLDSSGVKNLPVPVSDVDIDQWVFAQGSTLYTWGAGPCMNVVIHDAEHNRGCLAHISNIVDIGDMGNDSFVRSSLYHKACFSIWSMIRKAMPGTTSFEIWLGGGQAFSPGSKFVKTDDVNYDFPEYLIKFMGEAGVSVKVLDKRLQGSDIAYVPACNQVYDISKVLMDVHDVKTKEALSARIEGKCL